MNRFYKTVTTAEKSDGWVILLDERPVKTPDKQTLSLPAIALAQAIVEEWRAQKDEFDPLTMPLTRYANAAIDRTSKMRSDVIDQVCAYGNSDVLCYRVDQPADLAELQKEEWQPVLDWLSKVHEIKLMSTAGIVQVDQDNAAVQKIQQLVSSFDVFRLTALHAATAACGSIVLALALADGQIDTQTALQCATLEERYQMKVWGEDEETIRRHDELSVEIESAARFMSLALPGA
ncbi:MAG: ATPase [Rhodospirillaceae bacterium]|nr:ATPase [Rhodospirillaceae bacterium]|tara:strand:- start:11040 stop:11741 length:702 start_codon:yes stop_codon:yes gene_type:complete